MIAQILSCALDSFNVPYCELGIETNLLAGPVSDNEHIIDWYHLPYYLN